MNWAPNCDKKPVVALDDHWPHDLVAILVDTVIDNGCNVKPAPLAA
jgi:hypothetical protein